MLWKNILGLLIVISNLVGIILVCMNATVSRILSRKKSASVSNKPSISSLPDDEEIKDELLKDMDLTDLDDLNLDDFD